MSDKKQKSFSGTEQLEKNLKEMQKKFKQIEKESAKIKGSCTHKSHKGKYKIKPTDNSSVVRCEICKTKFGIRTKSKEDLKKFKNDMKSITNQIRLMCDDDDGAILKTLTDFEFNGYKIIETYEDILESKNKNHHKNNHHKKNKNYSGSGVKMSYRNGR